MKNISLMVLIVLSVTAAQAQFNPARYFTDSVSISFEACRVEKQKRKEVNVCIARHYKATANPMSFRIEETIEPSANSALIQLNYYGDMENIDFNKSVIQPYTSTSTLAAPTQPEGIYELRLSSGTYKPSFTSEHAILGKSSQQSVKLYFKSKEDALAANNYLKRITIER